MINPRMSAELLNLLGFKDNERILEKEAPEAERLVMEIIESAKKILGFKKAITGQESLRT